MGGAQKKDVLLRGDFFVSDDFANLGTRRAHPEAIGFTKVRI